VSEIGRQIFMVKAFDASGNESVSPTIDSITVVAPPDMNFLNTFDRWSVPLDYILSNLEQVCVNHHNAGYVRPCLAIKTANTWEDLEAEGETWEKQESDGDLLLNGPVEASGYCEMVRPYDLGVTFTFKIILDASLINVTGGTVTVQISTSEDGIAYSAFADIDAATFYRARYVKFKIILAAADINYNVFLYDLFILFSAPAVKKAWFQDVAIPITGKKLTFGVGFTAKPRLSAAIVNGVVGQVVFDNKTPDNVDAMVYDYTGSPIGTAEIDVIAEGN
jgi:hypothetical protein